MQIDEEYFQSEEFRELLERYETAMESGQQPFLDADDYTDIADYYSWHDDAERASQAVDMALDIYPEATLPNVFKARQALLNEDYEQAEAYLDNIGDHDDPDYHYLKAEIMVASGDEDAADEYLREYGHSVAPDEQEDFIRDCANLFIDYGVSDKAYQWMMRSKGDNSDDFKELMARTLFGLGKYKDSERLFGELVDQHPFSKNYWNALASAQYMSEDYTGAITSSEYAIAIDPNDPDGILQKACGLLRIGNYEEALKYYQRYTAVVPDDEYGLLNQGVCLVNLGRCDDALPALRMALAICPKDSPYLVQIYQETAFCYGYLHQPQQALSMLDKTDALDCDHTDVMVVRGHILLQNGLVEEAEEAFQKAIKMSHNAPNVLLRIIVSLYDNQYVNACYEMLLKFLAMTQEYYPDFKGGYAYMALCCYDLRRTGEFMKYLALAVENSEQEAKAVLGFLFPEGMPVTEYVKYMESRL